MSFISTRAVYSINILIDIINIIILIGVFVHALINLNPSKEKKFFLILLCTALVFNFGDLGNWTCEGFKHPWNVPALHILSFVTFIAAPMIYIVFMKLVRLSYKQKLSSNIYYFFCIFFCSLSVLMGFLSCFPGFLYYFDSNNIYHRSSYHIIVSINTVIYYIFSILYICSLRKQISKKEFLILLSFPTFPVFSYIPQIFISGIASINIGILISILIIYNNVLTRLKLKQSSVKNNFTSEFFVKPNLTFFERIKRGFFYYGYSEGVINSVKQDLYENVAYTLKLVCATVCIMDSIVFVLSFFQPVLEPQRIIYLMTLLLCFILLFFFNFFKKNHTLLIILSFIFIILIYALNMYKSLVLTPEELPLLFCCILFIVPSIFCYMPHMICFINISTLFIYMDLARIYKPAGAHLDSTYLIFLSLLGIIIGYGISQTKVKSIYLSKNLNNEIIAKTKQLNGISDQIVKTIVYAIETKDNNTKGHAERVAEYSVKIGKKLQWQEQKCKELWLSAILHDVGKIGIPDNILKKQSDMTDEEYEIIKKHTEYGENILSNLTYYPVIKLVARSHHERFDGTGYPDKLAGKDIPIEARIVAVADAYDAMSSRCHHKDSFDRKKIIEELIKGRATQFDPEIVNIFLDVIEEELD